MSSLDLLSIGEVARATGKAASAIRYYEEIGLVSVPVRLSGRRMYDPGVVRTLAVIETAQRAAYERLQQSTDEARVKSEHALLALEAHPEDRAALAQRGRALARPQAAAEIARAILARAHPPAA